MPVCGLQAIQLGSTTPCGQVCLQQLATHLDRHFALLCQQGFHPTLDIWISSTTNGRLSTSITKIEDLYNYVKSQISITQAAYKRGAGTQRRPAQRYKVRNEVFLSMK